MSMGRVKGFILEQLIWKDSPGPSFCSKNSEVFDRGIKDRVDGVERVSGDGVELSFS